MSSDGEVSDDGLPPTPPPSVHYLSSDDDSDDEINVEKEGSVVEGDECRVCSQLVVEGAARITTACGKVFHHLCVDELQTCLGTCPGCDIESCGPVWDSILSE